MFPRSDGILLGGTHELGVWSLEPDLEAKQRIVAEHQRILQRDALTLEREQHLQIDAPTGRAGRKRRARQRVRCSEQARVEVANRSRIVHVIQQVASADAKGQVVFAVGLTAEGERSAAGSTAAGQTAATQATSATRSTPAAPRSAGAVWPCTLGPRPNGLAQPQVQTEDAGTASVVDRDERLSRQSAQC